MKHHPINPNKKKVIILLISVLSILLFVNLNHIYKPRILNTFNSDQSTEKYSDPGLINEPKTATPKPNGQPLLVNHYANTSKIYSPSTLPTNISFTLVQGWTSKNINISYEGVSVKKDRVINGTFDSNYHGWSYETNTPAQYTATNGSGDVDITLTSGAKLKGEYGYFERNVSISEQLSSDKLGLLSFDCLLIKDNPSGISAYLAIIINGVEKNITYDYSTQIPFGSPGTLTMVYDPKAYGQELPGNVTIRVGVYTESDTSVTAWSELRIDNIKFDLWTMPNQINMVKAYDIEFDTNSSYINTTYGKGYSYIDAERTHPGPEDIIFTISKNVSGIGDFDIAKITITSNLLKKINSSIYGIDGSLYTSGIPTTWATEMIISMPLDYVNNRAEILKPVDWNITQIQDGYNVDQLQSCTGNSPGSSKLIIPNGVLDSGLWKIEATSQNYISNGSMYLWNGSAFNEASSITTDDEFRITVNLNSSGSLPLINTQINCTIFYPNGSIYYEQEKLLQAGSFSNNFGNFTVGNNMSVGMYQTTLIWTNNQSYLGIDKVGFLQFGFNVWHHTNLTAVNDYEEKVSGEPFLMKVEFVDYDSSSFIDFATVTYNSTFGTSGTMVYFGSGVYVTDMDISGLALGNYYFSFNASKTYYENQSIRNLILLKIISQPLALEVPQTVIHVDAYSFAVCRLNITGASTGTLLSGGVNISIDWQEEYWVTNHFNGTVTLNLSTSNVPNQGFIETFTVSIFANKTNYGSATAFISLTVHPLSTTINVNASTLDVKLHTNFILKLNYSADETSQMISEAILNISWASSYDILSNDNNYIINFSTFDISLGSYTVLFQISHPGYETAFENVYVNILPLEINVDTIALNGTLDVLAGKSPVISILLTEESSGTIIENANVTFSWLFQVGELAYKGNGIFELKLSVPESAEGAYTIEIIITTDNPEFKNRNFPLNIYVLREIPPNYLFIGIVIALLSVVGVLSTLSLRSYVIVPRKRKKELIFQNTIQVFKDVKNIQAVMIIQRSSGMPFFNKNYASFESKDNFLLSGFIQAITLFGEQMINGKSSDIRKGKHKEIYTKNIIELNFKFFHLLICDYQSVRSLLILREKSSKRLKKQFYLLSVEIDTKLGNKIENFKGKLEDFEVDVDALLNKFLSVYLLEPYKLIEDASYMQYLKKGRELHSIETRILNVIIARTKFEKEFTLIKLVEEIDETNVDKIYGGLHTLIGRNIIVPIHYKKSDSHPLLGGFK